MASDELSTRMIIVALESRVRTTWRKHVKFRCLDKSHASLLHQSSSVWLQFEASTSGQELRDMDQERFQVKSCPIWMLAACETDRLVGDNSSTILIRLSRQKATENSRLNAFNREMWGNIGQPNIFQQEYSIDMFDGRCPFAASIAPWQSMWFDLSCCTPEDLTLLSIDSLPTAWSSNSLCEESPQIPNQQFNSSTLVFSQYTHGQDDEQATF